MKGEEVDYAHQTGPPSGTEAWQGQPDEGLAAAPLVVAIGASAGGLTAFQSFFANMPADSGMVFVLVPHLDPHYQSMMVDILTRTIKMPVLAARDGTAITPDTVYVIPPDATLTIRKAVLHVAHPAPPRLHRWPIDTFFMSLAEDQGENAVGIVLSGVGSDGSSGISAVKAHGGLTFAQSEYAHIAMRGMPESATATGFIDFVLSVEEMPARLLQYRRDRGIIAERRDGHGLTPGMEEVLPSILALLHARLGHDFSQYKTSTLIRRIQRHMKVLGIDNPADVTDRLRREPAQLTVLFRDLLIGVTQFMRDPAAFAVLQESGLPAILEGKTSMDQLRVWVPACSTGEEVYSIAILLREACEQAGIYPKVQIFGSDINEAAIAIARAARYPAILKGMSPARAARWFVKEDDCCRVSKPIREMCVFSTHSLIKDPPFSRLNLISCRNLLIYLNTDLQETVIRLFHYALCPDGLLLLGPSEHITRAPRLFHTIDRKHRLYRKQPDETVTHPLQIPAKLPEKPNGRRPARSSGPTADDRIDRSARAALERHTPAYIVVNDQYDIMRFSGGESGRYLEPSAGTASLGLFSNLRRSLRPVVRIALQTAFTTHQSVQDHVPLEIDGHLRMVTVIVEPMSDVLDGSALCVVAFRDLRRVNRRGAKAASAAGDAAHQALEAELLATRERLQVALEAAETANEKAHASIEECRATNEELQSTNEELETAKEEMQSINEELQTVNTELSLKNDQLTRLHSDLQNLLENTQIATIFLDPQMRIKGFTPAMNALFNLRNSDNGRPLSDIAMRLVHPGLWTDIRQVLHENGLIEREVRLADAPATFLMRIMPYNTAGHGADGVVLTFVDISAQKKTEQALRVQASIIEFAHDAFLDAFFGIGFDKIIRSWNPAAERLFGYEAAAAIGQPVAVLCPQERWEEQVGLMVAARSGIVTGPLETQGQRRDGSRVDIELTVVPIRGDEGELIAYAGAARDISERKKAERHRDLLLHELSHRVKNALATVQSMAVQSLRGKASLDAFRDVFLARLIALASTHDLLTNTDWKGALLRDVVETELKPYQPKDLARWTITGPDIKLDPKSALALGMAFHELVTNAVKFGSLSVPGGRLSITWREEDAGDEQRLHVVWAERDGPPVAKPERRGFGSRLIADGLAYELDGMVEVDFDPAGVRCIIDVPLHAAIEDMT